MLKLIVFFVACWFIYNIMKGISTSRSQEIGKEARHIAISEFSVPVAYYNNAILNHIEHVKKAALFLKEQDDKFRNLSWPRLIAWTIYGAYRDDCEQYRYGNPISQNKFEDLNITSQIISSELQRAHLATTL
ncbi:hypothetical protein [Pelagibaculum spongiae]|uniref:Uncharacterized protein n=1 Tax=Pelagibaculum spongiae TaxID=2080658 RepID=A0A2V1GX19_9GAMM|nr:hypothetical protein [Pelagibaculum spongiae]PVZ71721.1 hypothetical protein DC094_01460 [Pelagibaculum spongiae]